MAIPGLFRLLERCSKRFFLFLFFIRRMSILHQIAQRETWEAFYECKSNDGYLSPSELRELKLFITKERYRPMIEELLNGGTFCVPVRREISKIGKQKKRVVLYQSRN